MKKLIPALLVCTLIICILPARATENNTIRWGVDGGYPPFDMLAPNGEIIGFDIDIANALCVELNARCIFVKQPFESMVAALNAKKIDAIIASLTITAEREKEVSFTDKYYATTARLVVRKGSGLLPDVASLKGKTVGVQTGSSHDAYAKKNWAKHGVKVVTYANQESIYLDLLSGRIQASLQDNLQAASSFLEIDRGRNFEFAGATVSDNGSELRVGIAVAKDNPQLLESLNLAIKKIRDNGAYDQIREKYFSFDIYGQ